MKSKFWSEKTSLSVAVAAFGLALVSSSAFAKDGGASTGGGFSFYYTSRIYYSNVKKFIAGAVESAPKPELQKLEEKYKVSIDWKRFAEIVRKGKALYDANLSRPNPEGDPEPLIMNYDPNNQTISALSPFFQIFNKPELTVKESMEMERFILHETSHLFGIGTQNDDKVSRQFSKDLMPILNRYWYRCGTENLSLCDYVAPEQPNDGNPGVREIRVSVSENREQGAQPIRVQNDFDFFKNTPAYCGSSLSVWRRSSDLSLVSVAFNRGTINGNTQIFDVSNYQAGDILVVTTACLHLYGVGKLKFRFSDQFGQSIFSDEKCCELKVDADGGEESHSWKSQFVKKDDGTLAAFQ